MTKRPSIVVTVVGESDLEAAAKALAPLFLDIMKQRWAEEDAAKARLTEDQEAEPEK